MAIYISDGSVPKYNRFVRGDTRANLLAGMHTLLSSAGWGSTTITGGYQYQLQSPQGLLARCNVWDPGSGDKIKVKFLSEDLLREGPEHQLVVKANRYYRMHAGVCQLFQCVAGVSNSEAFDLTSLSGGIPFVPELDLPDSLSSPFCPFEPDAPTECWWSCGDLGSGSSNFRNSRNGGPAWSACFNGELFSTAIGGIPDVSALRLVPITISVNVDHFFGIVPETEHYPPGSQNPLFGAPWIAFGTPSINTGRVRGILWNSMYCSMARILEDEISRYDLTWVNYIYDDNVNLKRSKHISLFLLKSGSIDPNAPASRGYYVY